MRLLLMLQLMILVIGCSKSQLTQYPQLDPAASIDLMRNRNAQIHFVHASGLITLSEINGQSVRLDGIMLLQRPDKMRLRAWKMGSAVFDLTVNGEASYQYIPHEEAKATVSLNHNLLLHWQHALIGDIDSNIQLVKENRDELVIKTSSYEDWYIDRKTLTTKRIVIRDNMGITRFELYLDDYESYGGVVWPRHVKAIRDSGEIDVHFASIEVNSDSVPEAFVPPTRAERLP